MKCQVPRRKTIFIKLSILIFILQTVNNCKNPQDRYVEENLVYRVIETDKIPNIKYSADIILNKKLSLSDIQELAYYIYRKKNLDGYERAFLIYYLQGMERGSGGWATSHFNPDLEIDILGLSIDEEKFLMDNRLIEDEEKKIIGEWIDEQLGYSISIYAINNRIFGRYLYRDGTEEINKFENRDDVFYDAKRFTHGEYYQVLKQNNMGIFDDKGIIYLLKNINP